MTTTDRQLTAAARRSADPDRVFSSIEVASGMNGPAEEAAAAAHFQARADRAFRLYGLGAPPISFGESLTDYRRRLCQGLAGYSDTLRSQSFAHVAREQLPPFEKMLTDDAVELFERPEGPLRSCTRRGHAGREVTHFFGDEQAAWLPFTNAVATDGSVRGFKRGRINGELFTGRNSSEARAFRSEAEARAARAEAALQAAERAGS